MQAAERLRLTTKTMVELSQLRAGALTLEPAVVEPRALLDGSLGRHLDAAKAKGLDLAVTVDPSVPEELRVDGGRVARILDHLVDDAVAFTASGRVEVMARWSDRTLRLEVVDTGVGIPTEARSQAFMPFVQLEGGVRRVKQGCGLGLALVDGLVRALGGSVELDGSVGEGTRVVVTMPAEPASAERPSCGVRPGDVVLVVDDDRLNRRVLGRALARRGLEVVEAEDGEAALARVDHAVVRLVIMDYEMPRLDGLEATRRLLERHPEIPVMGWTASARPEVRTSMRAAGVRGFLEKPLDADSLDRLILSKPH